jgi:hypothetical protein
MLRFVTESHANIGEPGCAQVSFDRNRYTMGKRNATKARTKTPF